MHLPMTFGTIVQAQDREPWGKAFSYSVGSHAVLLIFLFIGMKSQPVVQTVLTEVNFIERAPAPPPVTEAAETERQPEKKSLFKTIMKRGKSSDAKALRGSGGEDARDRSAVRGGIDISSAKGTVKTNPELTNKVAVSNASGRPDGQVVTSEQMSGPIVSA